MSLPSCAPFPGLFFFRVPLSWASRFITCLTRSCKSLSQGLLRWPSHSASGFLPSSPGPRPTRIVRSTYYCTYRQ
jgi:hypothetical protein